MIKITQTQDFNGPGRWSMVHESCREDNLTEFIVDEKREKGYSRATGRVTCVWCGEEILLSVIVGNYERDKLAYNEINIPIAWDANKNGEEQK